MAAFFDYAAKPAAPLRMLRSGCFGKLNGLTRGLHMPADEQGQQPADNTQADVEDEGQIAVKLREAAGNLTEG